MPQIVKLKSYYGARNKVFSDHVCSDVIAGIMSEWAHIEVLLASFFGASMGTHSLTDDGGVSVNQNWLAVTALNEINSVHGKIKVVEKTIKPFLTEELVEKWKKLKKEIFNCAEDRNFIAHTAWYYSEDHSENLVYVKQTGQTELYSKGDLEVIFKKINKLYDKLWLFERALLIAKSNGEVKFPANR